MLLSDPKLALKIGKVASKFKKILGEKNMSTFTTYEPEVVRELTTMLKLYAEVLTPDCVDYYHYSTHLFRLFNRSFGSWFSIPHHC